MRGGLPPIWSWHAVPWTLAACRSSRSSSILPSCGQGASLGRVKCDCYHEICGLPADGRERGSLQRCSIRGIGVVGPHFSPPSCRGHRSDRHVAGSLRSASLAPQGGHSGHPLGRSVAFLPSASVGCVRRYRSVRPPHHSYAVTLGVGRVRGTKGDRRNSAVSRAVEVSERADSRH